MNCPRGGRAFSTRRAVMAVKITKPPKLTTNRAITAASSMVIGISSSVLPFCCNLLRDSLCASVVFRPLEFHRAVFHTGEAELQEIQGVVLVQFPRPL